MHSFGPHFIFPRFGLLSFDFGLLEPAYFCIPIFPNGGAGRNMALESKSDGVFFAQNSPKSLDVGALDVGAAPLVSPPNSIIGATPQNYGTTSGLHITVQNVYDVAVTTRTLCKATASTTKNIAEHIAKNITKTTSASAAAG